MHVKRIFSNFLFSFFRRQFSGDLSYIESQTQVKIVFFVKES